MITVEDADSLAIRAHGGDRMKSGGLFIDHVRRAAAAMESDPDPYAVVVALLHDTVEKAGMPWDELRAAGADDRLVVLVDLLTERDDEPERDYLARCAADPLTLRIKRADIRDKLALPSTATFDVVSVYANATRRLDLLEQLAKQRTDLSDEADQCRLAR